MDTVVFSYMNIGFTSIKRAALSKQRYTLKNTCQKCLVDTFTHVWYTVNLF